MLSSITSIARTGISALSIGAQFGIKTIKYFIDSTFRDTATPVPGSVLYCDLWIAVEHSGIYVGDGEISNIVVDGIGESTVCRSSPRSFTSKSTLGQKIYVSCGNHGAVGHPVVAHGANSHVGERAFYGLVFKNCHQFSTKCVDYIGPSYIEKSALDNVLAAIPNETWEPTMLMLKETARKKLGATKWRLWDWNNDLKNNPPPEPDWQAHADFFQNQPLTPSNIEQIRAELAATKAYEDEVGDETIPEHLRQRLKIFRQSLADISEMLEKNHEFISQFPDAGFSYADLKASPDDFSAMAAMLRDSSQLKELVRKMGRNYISEEMKRTTRIPQASKSEVHGTHRSDDLMRVLPSEFLNLEDETLETLFYSRLLERNLLSYALKGVTFINGEETIRANKKYAGPVVACLDTSGSMQGTPITKAKALLLAVAGILKRENRTLHVLLFGSVGQIRELSISGANNSAQLLKFLNCGFGGGTDFETPLRRALGIIASQKDYTKADILMISDGFCSLSPSFTEKVKNQKRILNCMIYSVRCEGSGIQNTPSFLQTGKVEDQFSDEIVVL